MKLTLDNWKRCRKAINDDIKDDGVRYLLHRVINQAAETTDDQKATLQWSLLDEVE